MGNLYQDLVVDKSADLVIHAGDHGCERAGCCLAPWRVAAQFMIWPRGSIRHTPGSRGHIWS